MLENNDVVTSHKSIVYIKDPNEPYKDVMDLEWDNPHIKKMFLI